MIAEIRLNKKTKTIKIVNRRHDIRLQHTGKTGPQGEKGDQGERGVGLPAGGTTGQYVVKTETGTGWATPQLSDKSFYQEFTVTDEVAVEHNLNKYPSVTVLDSAGEQVEGDVLHADDTSLTVSFSFPFSGRVICN